MPVLVPARVARSASVVWRTSLPWETMTTSSTVSSISESRWDETSTACPIEAWWRMKVRSHWMPWGSSPLEGSSRMRISGVAQQGGGQLQPLAHAEGELPDPAPGHVGEPDQGERLVTRAKGMPAPMATIFRWSSARRPGWKLVASSTAPTCWIGLVDIDVAPTPEGGGAAVMETRPSSIRRVVVLPEPLGPRKPVTRPAATSKLRSSTARTAPKLLGQASHLDGRGHVRRYPEGRLE